MQNKSQRVLYFAPLWVDLPVSGTVSRCGDLFMPDIYYFPLGTDEKERGLWEREWFWAAI